MALVEVSFNCRIHRLTGLSAPDLKQKLSGGKAICPIRRCRVVDLPESESPENVRGNALVKKYPEKCSFCGLLPDRYDFDVF